MSYDIEVNNLSFSYEDNKEHAIKNINLKVKRGETLGIMGPAGAGKSTLCHCLNGLIPHFYSGVLKGEVLILGKDTQAYSISYLSHRVGMLFDDPSTQLFCPTVEGEIAFGLENLGVPRDEMRRRVKDYMKICRLTGYEERNPHTLSGGEQQACAFAAILAMEPQIYVLDEPTSALDPVGTSQVFSMIKNLAEQRKHTIIIVSNKIEEMLGIVERLLIIYKGEIIFDGKPREVLQRVDELLKMGVRPPQVSELFMHCRKIRSTGLVPITLEEATDKLLEILPRVREGKFKRAGCRKGRREEPHSGKCLIEVKNVWFTYPTGTNALRGVGLKINEGELVGIVGQNGSGKTTLVKHFNGLLKPTKGGVSVYGMNTKTTNIATLASFVGFVFQNPDHQLFCNTVREELAFGPRNLGVAEDEIEKRIEKALKAVRLDDSMLTMTPSSLSTAQKQRVTIASVIAMETNILVVDEPTTGQDPRMRREIMDLMKRLNERGKTVIVITHDMNLVAEYVPRCIVMKQGKILIDGSTRGMFLKPEILAETYLKPPQITQLGQRLVDHGFPKNVLTVEEFCNTLENALR